MRELINICKKILKLHKFYNYINYKIHKKLQRRLQSGYLLVYILFLKLFGIIIFVHERKIFTKHNIITVHKISRCILLSCSTIRLPAGSPPDWLLYLIKDGQI